MFFPSPDPCPAENEVSISSSLSVDFPDTATLDTAYVTCPEGYSGYAWRTCGADGTWTTTSNNNSCTYVGNAAAGKTLNYCISLIYARLAPFVCVNRSGLQHTVTFYCLSFLSVPEQVYVSLSLESLYQLFPFHILCYMMSREFQDFEACFSLEFSKTLLSFSLSLNFYIFSFFSSLIFFYMCSPSWAALQPFYKRIYCSHVMCTYTAVFAVTLMRSASFPSFSFLKGCAHSFFLICVRVSLCDCVCAFCCCSCCCVLWSSLRVFSSPPIVGIASCFHFHIGFLHTCHTLHITH